jgi:HPt (histidine-containing phosphotransfer) domain-containing protein
MKRVIKISLSCFLITLLFIAGCAKPPTEDIDSAKQAVESAKSAGAEKYLPDNAKGLDDELSAAMDEVKVQDGKFPLFRKYDKAKEMFASARTNAEKLKTDTFAKKEEAKKNAIASLGEANSSISNANAMLEKAPAGKETKAEIEALKGDIKAAEDSLSEVQKAIDGEDYSGATAKANSIKGKADSVSAQVQQAIEKVEAAKKATGKKKGKK